MRSTLVPALLLGLCSTATAADYEEVHDLRLDAGDLDTLIIDVGAGSLDVTGVDGLRSIEVKATVIIPDVSAADGRKSIAKDLKLSLDMSGGAAKLVADFDHGFWGAGSNSRVDLEVRAPTTLDLVIEDGSGSMDVANFPVRVRIDDSSGSIDVRQVGDLRIHDGSGSIDVTGVSGNVHVDDGSGNITIEAVGGSVTIDDGSGKIRVSDVAKDLIILEDGSGGVSFSDVRGRVEEDG